MKEYLLPEFEYTVNQRNKSSFYYLVGGIYPKWGVCIDTIFKKTNPEHEKLVHAQRSHKRMQKERLGHYSRDGT